MAWSDVVQGARSGWANATGMLNQRRQNALDRLSQTASDIANRKFTAGENEKQRTFTAGESALERQNRLDVQKLAGKQSMDVAEFNKTANLELQQIVDQNNRELQTISDQDARERLAIEHQNRLDEYNQQFLKAYQDFPEGTVVRIDDPTSGVTYYANNPTEVEAYLTKVRENAAAAAAQAYRDTPEKDSAWWDAYMQVAPTLTWEGDPNVDALSEQLRAGMLGVNSALTPDQLDAAVAFFRGYFNQGPDGGSDTTGGGTGQGIFGGETLGERRDRLRSTTLGGGFGGMLPTVTPDAVSGAGAPPPASDYPSGIQGPEQIIYDQIMALKPRATTDEQTSAITEAIFKMQNENVSQDVLDELIRNIRTLINGTGTRTTLPYVGP